MKLRHLNGKQIEFMRTLREAGATSAATALTVDRKAAISPDELEELVEAEAISRVAPYQYFLRPQSRHVKLLAALDSGNATVDPDSLEGFPQTRAGIIKMIIFWLIIILIPLVLIQLLGTKA